MKIPPETVTREYYLNGRALSDLKGALEGKMVYAAHNEDAERFERYLRAVKLLEDRNNALVKALEEILKNGPIWRAQRIAREALDGASAVPSQNQNTAATSQSDRTPGTSA